MTLAFILLSISRFASNVMVWTWMVVALAQTHLVHLSVAIPRRAVEARGTQLPRFACAAEPPPLACVRIRDRSTQRQVARCILSNQGELDHDLDREFARGSLPEEHFRRLTDAEIDHAIDAFDANQYKHESAGIGQWHLEIYEEDSIDPLPAVNITTGW